MNVGETKRRFLNYVKTPDHTMDQVNLLHKNVSTIETTINDSMVIFGFSFETIVMFSLKGYNFVTNENHSHTTNKHCSQVLTNLYSNPTAHINQHVFDYVLDQILLGNEINLEILKMFIKDHDLIAIKINEHESDNVFDYLVDNKFFSTFNLVNNIKEIIQQKLWSREEIKLNGGEVTIKKENDVYSCSLFCKKDYKNLSFLNRIDLSLTESII
jgi:hypothetical protein